MKKSVVTNKSAKSIANRSTSSASSAASNERERHKADADSSTSDVVSKCPNLQVSRKPKTDCVFVQFDTEYIKQLMAFSCDQLVPFRYYGLGITKGPSDRRYPRAFAQEIMISGKASSDDKAGGRKRAADYRSYAFDITLKELYQSKDTTSNTIDESCRLSDVLIVHKRDFTSEVIKKFKNGDLICRNQLKDESLYLKADKDDTKVSLLPYPLLCIYFKDVTLSKDGFPRLLQVIFTSLLNKNLLKRNCPMEVVAREGFGSCIPSVSDVGDGIRLDPGILPPIYIDTVVETLNQLGSYLKDKELQSDGIETVRKRLVGFGLPQLSYVDTLMEALAKTDMEQLKSAWGAIKSPTNVNGRLPNRFEKEGKTSPIKSFEFEVCKMLPILSSHGKGVLVDDDDSPDITGYGSESDGEFDDPLSKSDEKFVIKKAAFISGMAGINIVEAISAFYIDKIKEGKELGSDAEAARVFAAYFEAASSGLGKRAGISHFNAAPNPTNVAGPGQLPRFGAPIVSTIDVTNVTTAEKCDFICRHIRACQSDDDKFKLLILEESASKHPTGGDLVYGVVRIIGRSEAVAIFHEILQQAFALDNHATSVLNSDEHKMRHLLQNLNLMSRDRDFVAYVNSTFKK